MASNFESRNAIQIAHNEHLIHTKPAVDIYETEEAIVVLVEMPNVKKENLQVWVEDGKLYITGKRDSSNINGTYLLRETQDLQYERIFELEEDLDPEKISASYQLGILKIEIGKKEKAKPKIIQVE